MYLDYCKPVLIRCFQFNSDGFAGNLEGMKEDILKGYCLNQANYYL